MMGKTTGWVIKCYLGTYVGAEIGNIGPLGMVMDSISLF